MILKKGAQDIANAFTKWNLWRGGGGGGSTVTVTPKTTEGVNIADITVDGVINQLFAPSGGGGNVGAQVDTLWSGELGGNDQTLSGNTEKSILDYDFIFTTVSIYNVNEKITALYESEINKTLDGSFNTGSAFTFYSLTFSDNNNFEFYEQHNGVGNYVKLTKIQGLKFAPINPNLHTYSTNEQVVGEWIDGKPLYEKTFIINSVSALPYNYDYGGAFLNDINISNYDFYKIENTTLYDVGFWLTLPYTYHSSPNQGISLVFRNNMLLIQYSNTIYGNRFGTLNVTLQYTKSTD